MTRRTGLKDSSVDRKVGVAVDLLLPERPPKVPHVICPQFVRILPTGDVLPPPASAMVSFMITSAGPARDTCDHLRCCQHRHPGPEHGNGPARPSCGRLSHVPRVVAKMISGGCSTPFARF
jgi:hypothetical protein